MVVPFAPLFGIGFGGRLPSRNVLVSEHFGARRFASIYGLLASASVAFGVVTPLIVGWSFDLTGSCRPAFPGGGVLHRAGHSFAVALEANG